MDNNFRTIQRALEAGNDALFEASRAKLSDEQAEALQRTRELMTDALAALVRLEAEILRQREESARWTQVGKTPALTRTAQP
jgi:hypothetical protein